MNICYGELWRMFMTKGCLLPVPFSRFGKPAKLIRLSSFGIHFLQIFSNVMFQTVSIFEVWIWCSLSKISFGFYDHWLCECDLWLLEEFAPVFEIVGPIELSLIFTWSWFGAMDFHVVIHEVILSFVFFSDCNFVYFEVWLFLHVVMNFIVWNTKLWLCSLIIQFTIWINHILNWWGFMSLGRESWFIKIKIVCISTSFEISCLWKNTSHCTFASTHNWLRLFQCTSVIGFILRLIYKPCLESSLEIGIVHSSISAFESGLILRFHFLSCLIQFAPHILEINRVVLVWLVSSRPISIRGLNQVPGNVGNFSNSPYVLCHWHLGLVSIVTFGCSLDKKVEFLSIWTPRFVHCPSIWTWEVSPRITFRSLWAWWEGEAHALVLITAEFICWG